jgi:hypothetical protein
MDQGETGQLGCFVSNYFYFQKEVTMAKSATKRVRKDYIRSGETKINKAAQLREFIRMEPELSYSGAKHKFDALGLGLTSAQFYSIRNEFRNKSTKSRKKITPAKAPVLSAKSACTMDPKTAAEIYGDPTLSLEASTQPPNVEGVLKARSILDRAYLEAWQIVGQNYDLVDIIVDDIQEKHKTH